MSQTQEVRGVQTAVAAHDGEISVIYRGTQVVKVTPKEIVLNTGGWMSNTTKLRMNQASNQFGLGYQVYQRDFRWYVKSGFAEPDVEFGGGHGHTHTILR